jgi:carbamoyltransferase
MRILGINSGFHLIRTDSAYGHDAAAVLLENGEVVAAVEEERLNRRKHTSVFPAQAIHYCLRQAACSLQEVDWIAVHGAEWTLDLEVYLHFLNHPRMTWPGGGRDHVRNLFVEHFEFDPGNRVRFCDHHLSHAWSAFGCSGFPESLVVTFDGAGDSKAGTVYSASRGGWNRLAQYSVPESLGMMYWSMTQLLGFRHFDEYKVMGLAPWGDPKRYAELFESLYELMDHGRYRFEGLAAIQHRLLAAGAMEAARRNPDGVNAGRADLAAALQQTLERISLHVIEHFHRTTGQKRLCLAGGVAHNCRMIGKIHRKGWFQEIFVQPAAHDGGGALGAALWCNQQHSPAQRASSPLRQVFWGPSAGEDDVIERRLAEWSDVTSFHRHPSVIANTAERLAHGRVVGWVQGRSEFGPRALGNRSILADPRPAANRERINAMIKKREAFRPFAPAIRQEDFSEYFDGNRCEDFPFMTVVVDVRESKRELLGAVTHVDGTARVQTVSRDSNPRFHALLTEFGRLTGIPILLNTSLNNHAEPMVQSVDDAMVCFLTSGLDDLVIEDYVVAKSAEVRRRLSDLIPSLPEHLRLFPKGLEERETGREFPISGDVFELLLRCDGERTARELLGRGITDRCLQELFELWTHRLLRFTPASRITALQPEAKVETVSA